MISSYLGEGVALDDAVGESMGETVTVVAVVAHYLARVDGGGCGCVHDCGCGPAGRRPQVLTSAIESWGRRIFCQEFVATSDQNFSLNYLGVALELL
jgi:hypothetical protein